MYCLVMNIVEHIDGLIKFMHLCLSVKFCLLCSKMLRHQDFCYFFKRKQDSKFGNHRIALQIWVWQSKWLPIQSGTFIPFVDPSKRKAVLIGQFPVGILAFFLRILKKYGYVLSLSNAALIFWCRIASKYLLMDSFTCGQSDFSYPVISNQSAIIPRLSQYLPTPLFIFRLITNSLFHIFGFDYLTPLRCDLF